MLVLFLLLLQRHPTPTEYERVMQTAKPSTYTFGHTREQRSKLPQQAGEQYPRPVVRLSHPRTGVSVKHRARVQRLRGVAQRMHRSSRVPFGLASGRHLAVLWIVILSVQRPHDPASLPATRIRMRRPL